jgi:hypothetical protein
MTMRTLTMTVAPTAPAAPIPAPTAPAAPAPAVHPATPDEEGALNFDSPVARFTFNTGQPTFGQGGPFVWNHPKQHGFWENTSFLKIGEGNMQTATGASAVADAEAAAQAAAAQSGGSQAYAVMLGRTPQEAFVVPVYEDGGAGFDSGVMSAEQAHPSPDGNLYPLSVDGIGAISITPGPNLSTQVLRTDLAAIVGAHARLVNAGGQLVQG